MPTKIPIIQGNEKIPFWREATKPCRLVLRKAVIIVRPEPFLTRLFWKVMSGFQIFHAKS